MKISSYACDICNCSIRRLTSSLSYIRIPIFNKTLSFSLDFLGIEKGSILDSVKPDLCPRCRACSNLEAARALVIQFEKDVKDNLKSK